MKFRIKPPGIRAQIFVGFILFTVIIVALLWVFQISLLNTFYKAIKKNEIKNTASYIQESMDSGDFVDILTETVKNTGVDIMITSSIGQQLINASNMHSELFKILTPDKCARIYAETRMNGGEFMQDYTSWMTGNGLSDDAFKKKDFGRKQNNQEGIVYLKTVKGPGDSDLLLILNTLVTPVDSTVDTLKIQLWCMTGVMILLSGAMALIISRKISKPITMINSGAKLLSQGEYNIEFLSSGSRETRELAATLNYTAGELSKVEGLRRELLANVSHDLRTPLTMISGYAEVMRDIPGENTPDNVQVIIDEAERLKNLVNDLLDISRLEAGKMELNSGTFNLTESIRQILTRYDKLADYTFDFIHGDDVLVTGDSIKLSQVVYNLVNNAITHAGEDKKVVLTQTVTGDRVRIDITDTGEGIEKDKLKDIWERYYKVDKEHKRSEVGTGLGLSIVKKILELHAGAYGVISSPGAGSTFWFELKLLEEDIKI